MRILHVCLCGPFTDGWNYQENMLARAQLRSGFDVTVLAPCYSYNEKGEIVFAEKGCFWGESGLKIIRVAIKGGRDVSFRLKRYKALYKTLEAENPDVIFVHGCQFLDAGKVASYVSKHNVKLFCDNHADFHNSARGWISAKLLHGILWKSCAHRLVKNAECFFGVTPLRCAFLKDVYRLPDNKVKLLNMGADDVLAAKAVTEGRKKIREAFGISENALLLVTGGKIDSFKREILELMRAVSQGMLCGETDVRLIVFGSVEEECRKEFDKLCDGRSVIYAGWSEPEKTYDFFAAADIAVFPGAHSVFWEEAAGTGTPIAVRRIAGMEHVDVCGNCVFIDDADAAGIAKALFPVISDQNTLEKMKSAAAEARNTFSYDEIARKSIGLQS